MTSLPLKESVQLNCNISDAIHATRYSLCVYLLKMREYFRWERGYCFGDSLPKEELTQWMSDRERLWDDLEDKSYQALPLNNKTFDPFEDQSINEILTPQGLVYSGGIGQRGTAHFFLATLENKFELEGYPVWIATTEQARDLTAPPAMSTREVIFIRRESLKRMLWERLTEWQWHQLPGMMEKALSFYDFNNALEDALEEMSECELTALVLHEIGEMHASAELGSDWHEMLGQMARSRSELIVRTVKDILADMLTTLPKLIKKDARPSLYFYFANQSPLCKHLFPSLGQAAQEWDKSGDSGPLLSLVERARTHWLACGKQILVHFKKNRTQDFSQDIEKIALSQVL